MQVRMGMGPIVNLQVTPTALTDAATSLTAIGTNLTEANAAAAAPTTAILPAAADEISTALAELFGAHGVVWQELAAQAKVLHQQFVALLGVAADAYHAVEDMNAESMLQPGYTYNPVTKAITLNGAILQPVGQGLDILHLGWGGSLLGLP